MVVAVPFAARALYSIYFASVVVLFLTGVLLAALRRTERLWEFCGAYCFCLLVSTLCSAIFPAAGAFDYYRLADTFGSQLPYGSGVYHLAALQELRGASSVLINPFGLQGLVTFPSFHTALALMTAAAWRDNRHLRWPMIVWPLPHRSDRWRSAVAGRLPLRTAMGAMVYRSLGPGPRLARRASR